MNTLFDFDERVLAEAFGESGVVFDLGCGTGRALVPLVRKGLSGVAVDLSLHMLQVVQQKADFEGLEIECLQANLVELDSVRDAAADHCMCMFSTLGMVRGQESRRQLLSHTRRILPPGGRLVLHVHNLWYNLYDPGGPWWVVKNVLRSVASRIVPRRDGFELGDKFFTYRGIPNMYLHVFRRRELKRELRLAGFRNIRFIPLNTVRRHALRWPWLLGRLRANGWIVVCE